MKKRLALLAVLVFVAIDSASPFLHNHTPAPPCTGAVSTIDAGHRAHDREAGEFHGVCFVCLYAGTCHFDGAFIGPALPPFVNVLPPVGGCAILNTSLCPGGPVPRAPPSYRFV